MRRPVASVVSGRYDLDVVRALLSDLAGPDLADMTRARILMVATGCAKSTARRLVYAVAGRCGICSRMKLDPSKLTCDACVKRANERERKRIEDRDKLGLCRRCPEPPARATHGHRCARCADMQTKNMRDYFDRQRGGS